MQMLPNTRAELLLLLGNLMFRCRQDPQLNRVSNSTKKLRYHGDATALLKCCTVPGWLTLSNAVGLFTAALDFYQANARIQSLCSWIGR